MTNLSIDRLSLTDVGGFRQMEIDFGPRLNIICGPNGVGKTTILDAIGAAFVGNYSLRSLRRRAGSDHGQIKYCTIIDGEAFEGGGSISGFNPGEESSPYGRAAAKNLIYVRSNRDFTYIRLEGVLRDPDKDDYVPQSDALNGISIDDVKHWFINRYLMFPHGSTWPEYRRENFELASTFFSILDPEVTLKYVDTSTFDIMLQTPSGIIPFEYMSAGFRASYALIFGILKEIEFRKLEQTSKEFSGIILVDEIDLHLHPTWHAPMLSAIATAYPLAQIIVTTHSPHIIQAAQRDNLIILPKNGCRPKMLNDVDADFGLIGWTIEEILRDVMGMDDARPPVFAKLMEDYEDAVTRKDLEKMSSARDKLLKALHPNSIVRQIIAIESL